ncbi:serine/threonine protein kinase [Synechococcus sp. J7-Johnson]|uniref:serine/threonine protein kinase n=1 Tax=Synechococcus sp. J7-Johnson TaxID=2823737 RepID=UPI0020CCA9C8|nr:serine/threonine protein kinase [Synechococcus sp. J7-Johnson]MCP9840500.1 serine/threonine protein kinase [Synechococcus sp. J7-Johnson]
MDAAPAAGPGLLIADRYRLEAELSRSPQGVLWRASDQLAGGALMALRQLGPEQDQQHWRQLWSRLQGVLHPQIPRIGEAISRGEELWLVREWQGGPTYRELLEARRERQLVFGAGEVLLLVRQLLPVLAALHGQDLVHADLSPANLLRRDRDGLPVLLDFGLVRDGSIEAPASGATPGYAPAELGRGEPVQPWMDLHALGVVALVLLTGEEPASMLDPNTLAWSWPAADQLDPALREQLERLLSSDPEQRFTTASQALEAFQQLPMPESLGPVARADRTVVLVSPSVPSVEVAEPPAPAPPPPAAVLRSRQQVKDEAVEGRLWPMVMALVISAVVGISLGWWLLGRGNAPSEEVREAPQRPLTASLPPGEVDQRQELLNRLRALQVDRGWFLNLVDANLMAQFPERGGRLPSDALQDAPLRKVWNELAEEWLARVEQLPIAVRRKLGSLSASDWEGQQRRLAAQGLSAPVLRQLVSGNAQSLLPGRSSMDIPPEPFRQLWYAAAQQTLESLRVEPILAPPGQARVQSAELEANGARVFPIRIPRGHQLVLGVNGSPLMQMSVFDAQGNVLEPKGPLRVVSLGAVPGDQAQLLISNEGVAPAYITLSLRADPPPPAPSTPETGERPEPEGQEGGPARLQPTDPDTPDSEQRPAQPEAPSPPENASPQPR